MRAGSHNSLRSQEAAIIDSLDPLSYPWWRRYSAAPVDISSLTLSFLHTQFKLTRRSYDKDSTLILSW